MAISVDIPEKLLTGVKLGQIKRYGVVLKNAQTGKIVGHLRETKSLINLVGQVPANPVQLVSSLVSASSGLAANYQLHKQGKKIDVLDMKMDKLSSQMDILSSQNVYMTNMLKTVSIMSGVGAVASIATFAICASGFKAVSNRLDIIEQKMDGIINRLDKMERNFKNREIRGYLSKIKHRFDYLMIPDISVNLTEFNMSELGKTFTQLNYYLQSKLREDRLTNNFEEILFLFNVMIIASMGELKGLIILDKREGAEHILQTRVADLKSFKNQLLDLNNQISSQKNMQCSELSQKQLNLALLINTAHTCCEEIDSQRLVISDYVVKNQLSLKGYYEDTEGDNTEQLIKFIEHSPYKG